MYTVPPTIHIVPYDLQGLMVSIYIAGMSVQIWTDCLSSAESNWLK